ncbi:PmoA family protein [Verrucomicrobium spinosum]|uniref:DUF6807 domain-containing protein n=1 Tax=Verrucomicrobium spinosum TaxID=2736 RepID=UPI0001746102|nr:PmoA family protein [Verrucomicrobium spinosum]
MRPRFLPLPTALSLSLAISLSLAGGLSAADAAFTIQKTGSGGLVIQHEGKPFAEYVVDQGNKPYLAPVFGPTGKQMTRSYPMKTVDGEQHDHPHHRGICFGLEDTAGFDTWAEKATFEEQLKNPKQAEKAKARLAALGAIKHREYKEIKGGDKSAVVTAVSDILDVNGRKLMEEQHTITFSATADTRVIDFDIDFIASEGPVKLGDKKDSGFSIRVPTSMAVKNGLGTPGGTIINSEGVKDTDAWAKRAKWCDYSGPVEGETLGVAMLNHPSSFRYPTPWHVRDYGLFTANPFGIQSLDKTQADGTVELKKDEHLKLRHRLIFHKGDAKSASIESAWEAYSKEDRK